jgi:cytochrome b pre-mRNA-processing protein 3
MLAWLRQLGDQRRTARSLYGSIVTQARRRNFYAALGVPDTPEGRFEMIALHLVLVLRRLAREGAAGQRLARTLTETFVVDLDDTLREMTVGDLAVPRHVKRAVAVLHDRYATYGAGLGDGGDAGKLAHGVREKLGAVANAESLDAESVRSYIEGAARDLNRQAGAEILAGRLDWPQI